MRDLQESLGGDDEQEEVRVKVGASELEKAMGEMYLQEEGKNKEEGLLGKLKQLRILDHAQHVCKNISDLDGEPTSSTPIPLEGKTEDESNETTETDDAEKNKKLLEGEKDEDGDADDANKDGVDDRDDEPFEILGEETKTFYLFARTSREKEEWFNRLTVGGHFMRDWNAQVQFSGQ